MNHVGNVHLVVKELAAAGAMFEMKAMNSLTHEPLLMTAAIGKASTKEQPCMPKGAPPEPFQGKSSEAKRTAMGFCPKTRACA